MDFATIDRNGIEAQRSVYAPNYNAAADPNSDLTQWLEGKLSSEWAASFSNPHGLSSDELKTAIAEELKLLAPRYKTDFSVDDAQFQTDFKAKIETLFSSPHNSPYIFSQLFSPLVFDNPATTNKVETVPADIASLADSIASSVGANTTNEINTLKAVLTTLRDDAKAVGISNASFESQVRAEAAKSSVNSISSFVGGVQDFITKDIFSGSSTTADQVRTKYQKLAGLSFTPASISTQIADQLGNDLMVLMEASGNLYKDPKAGVRYNDAEKAVFKTELEAFAGRLVAEAGQNRLDIGGLSATLIGRMEKFTASNFLGADVKALAVGTVFAERMDEKVIFAYKNRALATSDKRDLVKAELEKQTAILKAFSGFQTLLNSHLSSSNATSKNDSINYAQLGFSSEAEFLESKDYQYLNAKYNLTANGNTISLATFGSVEGISIPAVISQDNDGDDWRNRTSELATSISNKSKTYSDEVSLKTTELNDVSSRYNSAIEALNKFVQKYSSILQDILRAI